MGWQWKLPLARYGECWLQGRKLLDRGLRPGAAARYRPIQQARVRVLLTRLLETPDLWEAHHELCEIVFVIHDDISIHHMSFQFPRRGYFGYDVWIRSQGDP